jgi:hypothetical protein
MQPLPLSKQRNGTKEDRGFDFYDGDTPCSRDNAGASSGTEKALGIVYRVSKFFLPVSVPLWQIF